MSWLVCQRKKEMMTWENCTHWLSCFFCFSNLNIHNKYIVSISNWKKGLTKHVSSSSVSTQTSTRGKKCIFVVNEWKFNSWNNSHVHNIHVLKGTLLYCSLFREFGYDVFIIQWCWLGCKCMEIITNWWNSSWFAFGVHSVPLACINFFANREILNRYSN